jgi:hypothetical protein
MALDGCIENASEFIEVMRADLERIALMSLLHELR